ncbi:MAG: hypothetical protein ACFFCZ_24635 [Promethearchaeota archaeon]
MAIDLNFLILTLVMAFGLTALVTSMFEMFRTGFILTLHVMLQMLAFLAGLITWFIYFLDPSLTAVIILRSADLVLWGMIITAVLAILALLKWLKDMFTGLMLVRCMQGSSFHSHVLSHQLIFAILSLVAILALLP